jgi:hypothetical protein
MKVVPRLGQCTAAWTYWNGGGATVETNRYSEIDIEMPRDADYRQWFGTAYKYFYDWNTLAVRRDGVVKRAGLNDGNWHTYGFEWRTDAENGDEGVRWYMDGVQVLDIRGYTPIHTAHFQLGTWFPNEPSWVGIPDFEEAYMYVDWVRITGYDDPVTIGAVAAGGGGDPVDLGGTPLPRNNYISNGMFKRFSGGAFTGWEKTAGAAAPQEEGGVILTEEARIAQLIRGQYSGYRFDLTVDAQVTAGNGALTARVEYLTNPNSRTPLPGAGEELVFEAGDGPAEKRLSFTLPGPGWIFPIQAVRIALETGPGVTARINRVELYLRGD